MRGLNFEKEGEERRRGGEDRTMASRAGVDERRLVSASWSDWLIVKEEGRCFVWEKGCHFGAPRGFDSPSPLYVGCRLNTAG